LAAANSAGYGNFYIRSEGRRSIVDCAHRVAYRLSVGPIPEGHVVAHRCDVPGCCNPAHLFACTQAVNLEDCHRKGRHSHGADHSALLRATWTVERRELRAYITTRRAARLKARRQSDAGVPTDHKWCQRCESWLPPSGFHRHKNRPDGLHVYCRTCRSQRQH